ncbi:MAG: chemotaxis protein CheX [Nautiliaceae bacterium]|jgi:CheY-specific phosphatase CheX
MFNTVKEAVNNFVNSIEAKTTECNEKPKEGFVSKISVSGDENYDIYIVLPHEKLSYIANYYFGDDNYDVEDLTKEIANQIIGNAKIIAAKKNKNFDISIPEYLGEYKNDIEYDDMLSFKFNGDKCFYILFKGK